MNDLLFRAENVCKRYGTNTVLEGIDIEIRRGEIIGLIGENGAGKSTLMKIISGVEKPTSGTMELRGKPYKCNSMLEANRQGIGMVFQEQSLVSNLTVAQNIYRGRESRFGRWGFVNWKKLNAAAVEVLKKVDLEGVSPKTMILDLDFATRQMVEIAKVLDITSQATEGESIILLDEPTTVLSDNETQKLFREVRKVAAAGNAVLFISHRLQEVLDITDRIYVFKDGRKTAELKTADADEYVLYEKMVGRETTGEYYSEERQSLPSKEVVLSVKDLCKLGVFKEVSFDLYKGEVLGLCGVEGSGKEAVCAVLSGDEAGTDGIISIRGKKCAFGSPMDARKAGILAVPRDRRDEGMIGILSIMENISVSNYRKISKLGMVSLKKQRADAEKWVKNVGIKCTGVNESIQNLSGGNAQKVIMARALNSECPILVLDHPTRGVDIGSKSEIYALIRDLTEKGISVILLGDTLDECIGMASRIIVMKDGCINGEFDCPVGGKPEQIEVVQKMM